MQQPQIHKKSPKVPLWSSRFHISLVAANFENRPGLLYFNPGCNSNFLYNSTSRTLNCTNIVGMLNFIQLEQ